MGNILLSTALSKTMLSQNQHASTSHLNQGTPLSHKRSQLSLIAGNHLKSSSLDRQVDGFVSSLLDLTGTRRTQLIKNKGSLIR